MSELRRHIMMQQGGGGGYEPIKGVRVTDNAYFLVGNVPSLANGYEIEFVPINNTNLLTLYISGGESGGRVFGFWSYGGIYHFGTGSTVAKFTYASCVLGVNTFVRQTTSSGYMDRGGTIFQNGDWKITYFDNNWEFSIGGDTTARRFSGDFFGIKDLNGNFILEPCIFGNEVGLFNHDMREFIHATDGTPAPIYY